MRPTYEGCLKEYPGKERKCTSPRLPCGEVQRSVCTPGNKNPYELLIGKVKEACELKRNTIAEDLTKDVSAILREISNDLDRIKENRSKKPDVEGLEMRGRQAQIVRAGREHLPQIGGQP